MNPAPTQTPKLFKNPKTGQTRTVTNPDAENLAKADGYTDEVKTLKNPTSGLTRNVITPEDEKKAKDEGYSESTRTQIAPRVLDKKTVLLLIGERNLPGKASDTSRPRWRGRRQQTHFVHAHESVVDILKANRQATDGSLIALHPGTLIPFQMDDQPYDHIEDGDVIEVVPNRADQIGPFASEEDQRQVEMAAHSSRPVRLQPAPVSYPKTLHNPGKPGPDVTVKDADEEKKARADGFTVAVTGKAIPKPEEPKPPLVGTRDAGFGGKSAQPDFKPKFMKDPAGKRPNLMVHTPEEEADAKADGFTSEVAEPIPTGSGTEDYSIAGRVGIGQNFKPKFLSDPTNPARPHKLVQTTAAEAQAKAEGFTTEVPEPLP